ncbi:cytochrome [Rhodobacterales bacterium 52_120_T64]|nr:cytochrome [Rhodobacterales bacterium 52_120_T64]
MAKLAPKPESRPEGIGMIKRIGLFRRDIFSSQPARLYHAWMAQVRMPFYHSFLVNQPELVRRVLIDDAENFPKSEVLSDTLRPLLGDSIFATNAAQWRAQRDIINPAFKGCPSQAFSSMCEAGDAAIERLKKRSDGEFVEMEFVTSHLAADIIFRTLFSVPLPAESAEKVFVAFREYQKSQPLWSIPTLLKMPNWVPRFRSKAAERHADTIRGLLTDMIAARQIEIDEGVAPDDLATSLMTAEDPKTGQRFSRAEMVDQVAIFFLAGHETSASALSWAFYLLALDTGVQDAVATEAQLLSEPPHPTDLSKMRFTKDVFHETLRLYPPVPMYLRDAAKVTAFRGCPVPVGSMVIVSPWHLHRHERLWDHPDEFDPYRWNTENGRACKRDAFIPFSAGPRVCPGAGFGRIEGVLMLAMFLKAFRFETTNRVPVPVAHLTVRSKDGIYLRVTPRDGPDTTAEQTHE